MDSALSGACRFLLGWSDQTQAPGLGPPSTSENGPKSKQSLPDPYSHSAGHFANLANNPLKHVLERSFGPDLEMAQTFNNDDQWLRDGRGRGEPA